MSDSDSEGGEGGAGGHQGAVFGPALPPGLASRVAPGPEPACGPSQASQTRQSAAVGRGPIGPELPEHLRHLVDGEGQGQDSSEPEEGLGGLGGLEECFGPSPSLMAAEGDVRGHRRSMARPQSSGAVKAEREEWMTALPSDRAGNLGLGPRQFRKRPGPDPGGDRSVWTDTPQQKRDRAAGGAAPKTDDSKALKAALLAERDRDMERLRRKAEKKAKRDKSLVELHARAQAKQAKKEAKERRKKGLVDKVERRPFNRDTDLQVNRFDEAQKRAVLKKAQLLNDRFSAGEGKFL